MVSETFFLLLAIFLPENTKWKGHIDGKISNGKEEVGGGATVKAMALSV